MRLTHFLAATAAAFVVAAGSAQAATTVSTGYVDVDYSHVSFDPGNDDANAWGVGGAFATPLGETWGLQLDGSWHNFDPDNGDNTNVFAGTAHVFHRSDTNLIGGEVGVIHEDTGDTTTWGVGLEDDYYMSNTTLGGRVVYLKNDDDDVNFWGVEGHARYFVQDNFDIEGSLGFGKVDFNPGDENVWEAGLNAEYQLASAPISIFGGVNYLHADTSPDSHATTVSIGARWNFGGQTLKDRDRSGASLKGIDQSFGAGLASVF